MSYNIFLAKKFLHHLSDAHQKIILEKKHHILEIRLKAEKRKQAKEILAQELKIVEKIYRKMKKGHKYEHLGEKIRRIKKLLA